MHDDEATPTNPLAGTSWVAIAGVDGLDDVPVTLELTEDRIAGTSGCNRYAGGYTSEGGRLRLTGPLATTRMMCPEPRMAVEAAVLGCLHRLDGYRLDDTRLLLLDDAGVVLLELRRSDGDDPLPGRDA